MRIQFDIPETILHQLLDPVPIPEMARVHHDMQTPPAIDDVGAAVARQFQASGIGDCIQSGQHIAIGVGSRGIDRLPEVVAALVRELRRLGAQPFVIPTMGSHGGATPEGQREVLEHLGVTPERIGAPVESQMDTLEIGRIADGTPVRIDRLAMSADGIMTVARIKPHTAYHGTHESGAAKMIAIGLGKQAGAALTHAPGFGEMARMIPQMAEVALQHAPILGSLTVLENAHDRVFKVAVLPAERILADEPELLDEAKAAMAHLPFDQLDILVIDEIGKNISGDGADPNITGRAGTPYGMGKPDVTKQVMLDLASASGGNANGIGLADFITLRLARKADLGQTYPNALTSTVAGPVKIPMILPSDRLAFKAAILTCNAVGHVPRLVRIKNTLKVEEFWVSTSLLEEVRSNARVSVIQEPKPLGFDAEGNLEDLSPALIRTGPQELR